MYEPVAPMNNLNDPPRWNIQPDARAGGAGPAASGGSGSQWNYALLVPMLGLAAFRWIWTRESQREIWAIKTQYNQDVSAVSGEMEIRYRQTLTEGRRAAARLELELEKERQRVKGYKQALVSQSQQLMVERKQLQQERQALEQEKRQLVESGAAGLVLRQALQREEEDGVRQRATRAALEALEAQLVERQGAYCSVLLPRHRRLQLETNMLLRAVREEGPIVDLESDLKDIFKRDKHCADLMNADGRKNGSLMWLYLRYWRLQATLQKHKRAEEAVLGGERHDDNDQRP